MDEQEQEQNKRINQHFRRITNLEQRLKTLEYDVEPQGRISLAFEAVEEDLDEIKSSINQLDHNPLWSLSEKEVSKPHSLVKHHWL